jgi:sulfate transport system permease protein
MNRSVARTTLVPRLLTIVCIAFLLLFLVLPLIAVFALALQQGAGRWLQAVTMPDSLSAIRLSLLTAAAVVSVNTAFGLCVAWLLSKFRFRGRQLLLSLVDLPLTVSPVIAGLVFVLLFGRQGVFGPWLLSQGVHIIFAWPGIVLATLFVTLPYVAREVLALMQTQGDDEEEAALILGASGWQTFRRVTLPKVQWALLYGLVLCNARAMGEFGAVSVVSGHIRGKTNTLPLHVEILYNEYDSTGAFAVASLLAALALVTLVAKELMGRRKA